ncbi:MAG TPA: type II secretion system protein [Patescibacteria group bacterium]|nr:type II secretion system protein [Patescibacteria group bacterium]
MRAGYTLIELLVVIVVMTILFTVGFTTFQDYSKQQALLQTITFIQTDLRSIQEAAIAGNKPTTCTGTLNGYQFNFISATEYETDAVCSGGIIQIKDVNMPSDISLNTPIPNPLIFKTLAQGTNIPDGNSASIVITQASTGNAKTITIGSNGSIQ